jgi:two-component system sensor histidine kinase DesK
MITLLKKIDHFLLPRALENRLLPYVWLLYLFIFFSSLVFHGSSLHSYIFALIGTILFLSLYFNAYWASSKQVKWNILAILVIGSLLTTLTLGANVFFIYAAAFCYTLGSKKRAFLGLLFITTWIGLLSWFGQYSIFFFGPAALFSLMIGGINIYEHDLGLRRKELMLSQQEVKHLARTSERERIARDLHDLIGHTFSVITLKAELAQKLIDKDIDKARDEIKALENISRDALSQVREVVTGYRTSDLNTELAHAKHVLQSNDINFSYQYDKFEINDNINKELAIILKELTTNILKHADATRVDVVISQHESHLSLSVKDDGVGFKDQSKNGFGLKGIVERITKFDGKLAIQSSDGTHINISIPLLDNQG